MAKPKYKGRLHLRTGVKRYPADGIGGKPPKRPNPKTTKADIRAIWVWYWETYKRGQLMFDPSEEVLTPKQLRKKVQRLRNSWIP